MDRDRPRDKQLFWTKNQDNPSRARRWSDKSVTSTCSYGSPFILNTLTQTPCTHPVAKTNSLVILEARIFPTVQWESYFWLHVRVLFRVCVKLLKPDYSRPYVHNWPLKNLLRSNKYHQSLADWEFSHHHNLTDLSDFSLPLKTARWLEEHQLKGLQNNRQS